MKEGLAEFAYYTLASVFTEILFNKYLFEHLLCAGPCAGCNMEEKVDRAEMRSSGSKSRPMVCAKNVMVVCRTTMHILELVWA